jgi:hypothetical protein
MVEEAEDNKEDSLYEEEAPGNRPIPQMSFIKMGNKIIPRNVRNSRRRNS